jgi:hypothetical protein
MIKKYRQRSRRSGCTSSGACKEDGGNNMRFSIVVTKRTNGALTKATAKNRTEVVQLVAEAVRNI